MRRYLWVAVGAIGILILGSSLLLHSGEPIKKGPDAVLPNYPKIKAYLGNEVFTLLETRTQEEVQLGLGAVPQLPKQYGMLFTGKGEMGIWMKGMSYPIDIIWLNEKHVVIHVVRDAQPASYPKVTYTNPLLTDARYVIEVGAGETARLGVHNGMTIKLE